MAPGGSGIRDLRALSIEALRDNAVLRKRLQLAFPLIGTATATLLQLASKFYEAADAYLTVAAVAVIVGVLVVSALLLISDRNGPEALAEAHKANDLTEECNAEIGRLERELLSTRDAATSLSLLYAITILLREYVGPLLTGRGFDVDTRNRHFATMLDLVLAQKTELIGIRDERWNFSIYLPTVGGVTMRCAVCRRRDRAEEESSHREWPVGHGHVGRSFQDSEELVAEDTQSAAVEGYFRTPPELARSDDSARYRSIAAIPISLSGKAPSGVLIATSDIPGRFKPRRILDGGRDAVEPLRVLAASLAFVAFAANTENQAPGE